MIITTCGVHKLRILMNTVVLRYVASLPAITCVVSTRVIEGAGGTWICYENFVTAATGGVAPKDGVADSCAAGVVAVNGAAIICTVVAEGGVDNCWAAGVAVNGAAITVRIVTAECAIDNAGVAGDAADRAAVLPTIVTEGAVDDARTATIKAVNRTTIILGSVAGECAISYSAAAGLTVDRATVISTVAAEGAVGQRQVAAFTEDGGAPTGIVAAECAIADGRFAAGDTVGRATIPVRTVVVENAFRYCWAAGVAAENGTAVEGRRAVVAECAVDYGWGA